MQQRGSGTMANFMAGPFGSQIFNVYIHIDEWVTEKIRDGRRISVLIVELLLVGVSLVINLRLPNSSGSAVVTSGGLLLLFRQPSLSGTLYSAFSECATIPLISPCRNRGRDCHCRIGRNGKRGPLCNVSCPAAQGCPFYCPWIITLFLLLSTFHFGARIYLFSSEHSLPADSTARRAVIIGAGDAGASVLKELLETPRCGIVPVALVELRSRQKRHTNLRRACRR